MWQFMAICNPLLFCMSLTSRVYTPHPASGKLFMPLCTWWPLSACPSVDLNIIQHIFCDVSALLKICYSDTHTNQLLFFYFAGCMFTVLVVLISYSFILSAVLRTNSTKGREKVSLCVALTSLVSIFHGSFSFHVHEYMSYASEYDVVVSIIYTIVTAALNSIIYSLKNKDIEEAMQNVLG